MNNSRFITLEGGEGSGKSTQIGRLESRLTALGHVVTTTREPGGSKGGEQIRKLLVEGEPDRWSPMTEALLMYAARRDHVEKLIKPALARGEWVICDRFFDSTMAYQGYAGELGVATVRVLNDTVMQGFAPDLTLILDLPVQEGLKRAGHRISQNNDGHDDAEDRFEKKGTAFHEALRDGYLEIAAHDKQRCAIVDATGTPEDVSERLWQILKARLDTNNGIA